MKFETFELILIGVWVLSIFGISAVLLKKIPALAKLPGVQGGFSAPLISAVKKAVSYLPGINKFNYELYLQKVLSKIRILTMKTESKTGNWLERLRQRINQRNNGNHNDHYWDDLKNAKNG